MPVVNADVAAVFDEIADLLEVQDANAFRVRAYRNAARMLGELGRDLEPMVERGEDLDALPGIGPDLRGDLHTHTRDSDGQDDLEVLAEAARSTTCASASARPAGDGWASPTC
ncbi:hypothetical protein [Caldimonas aquatica]|uniref:hypothetical protein n=1 Tax=Caldimonas aquatica TaxID=376175 RepID=UPI003CC910AF